MLDHRLNTRTVKMNVVNRFLYWNMNYHVEHHMFPMVPYHRLPELHEEIKHDLRAGLPVDLGGLPGDHPGGPAPAPGPGLLHPPRAAARRRAVLRAQRWRDGRARPLAAALAA